MLATFSSAKHSSGRIKRSSLLTGVTGWKTVPQNILCPIQTLAGPSLASMACHPQGPLKE